MVNLTWLLLRGLLPLYCISFVFNLNPERRKEGEDLESPEGSNYVFSHVRCSIMTLQQDLSLLSVFSDLISVNLRK